MTFITLVVAVSVFVSFLNCHDHSHETPSEPASMKYSSKANQGDEGQGEVNYPGHGHAQEHEHGHDHNQGQAQDHGHAHDHGHGYGHHHGHMHDHGQPKTSINRDTGLMLWLEALGSTLLISVSPVFILILIPLDNTSDNKPLLKVLLSFASGGLLGDAFLYLIPHAISPHIHGGEDDHSHSHSHGHHSHDMSVGLWVLAGIVALLIVEMFVRYIKDGHSHSHGVTKTEKKKEERNKTDTKEDSRNEGKNSNEIHDFCIC